MENDERRPARIKKKIPHVDDRHGNDWPRYRPKFRYWTGWLTHKEYNVIESNLRFGHDDMHRIGKMSGVEDTTAERVFHSMVESGLLWGSVDEFGISPMGKILFDMTDQFILELDLGDE